MLRFAFSFLLLCVLSGFVPNGLLAHEYKTGDYIVILSNTHLEAEKPEEPHGEAVWLGRVLSVRKQVGNRLLLDSDKRGWLETQHVMPCDETAIVRFTEWIASEPENAKLYCGRGNAYFTQDNSKQAIDDFSEAIRLSPEAYFYAQRAKAYVAMKDLDKADLDIQKALEIDSRCDDAFYARVAYFSERHLYEQAIKDLNLLLQSDPEDYCALLVRSQMWSELDNQPKALADIETSMQICSTYTTSHLIHANVLMELQRYEDAIVACGKAITCDPTNGLAFVCRASIYEITRDYANAVADCDKGIQLSPKNPFAYYYRAKAYLAIKKNTEAFADFEEVLRLDPESMLPYKPRSEAYATLGQYDKAVEDLSKMIKADPKDKYAYQYRAGYLIALERYYEALEDCDFFIDLNPQSAAAFYNRGITKVHLNRFEEAEDDFSEAIFLRPQFGKAFRERGRTLCFLGRFSEGTDDLTKCLQLTPADIEAWALRASAYINLKSNKKAIADIEHGLSIAPNDTELLTLCIKAYDISGDYDLALKACEKVLANEPENVSALVSQTQCLYYLNRFEDTIKFVDKLPREKFKRLQLYTVDHAKLLSLYYLKQHGDVITQASAILKEFPRDAHALLLRGSSKKAQGLGEQARADVLEALKHNLPADLTEKANNLLNELEEHTYPVTETPFGPTAVRRTFGYPGLQELLTPQRSSDSTSQEEINDKARREKNLQKDLAEIQQRINREPNSAAPHLELASYWLKINKPEEAFSEYSEVLRLDPTSVKAYVMRAKLYADRGEYEKANADAERAFELDPSQGLVRYEKAVSIYGEGSE